MRIIKVIVERIKHEVKEADIYINKAILYKSEYPKMSDVFCKIGEDKLKNINMLHELVVSFINEYRSKKEEPPAAMMAIWEYEHKNMIDEIAELKVKLSMYRSNL